jgi:hypothetical protein
MDLTTVVAVESASPEVIHVVDGSTSLPWSSRSRVLNLSVSGAQKNTKNTFSQVPIFYVTCKSL